MILWVRVMRSLLGELFCLLNGIQLENGLIKSIQVSFIHISISLAGVGGWKPGLSRIADLRQSDA